MVVRLSRILCACSALAALPVAASPGTLVGNAFPGHATKMHPRAPHTMGQARRQATAACTTSDSQSFVGVSSANNVAGGTHAGVLSGENNEACDQDTGIGSGDGNQVYGNGGGAAQESFDGGGESNEISDDQSFNGAGRQNKVDAPDAFIGAGENNSVALYADDGAIAGGNGNQVKGDDSFVGGGVSNVVAGSGSFVGSGGESYGPNEVPGYDSFIGSGDDNTANADDSAIAGGYDNDITTNGTYAAIAGGYGNYASSTYAAIGGGGSNKAEGSFSMIPGGADNYALGAASFAAGYHAKASHNGSFVWSDDVSGSGYATDGNTNEFIVRASGGTYVFSNEAESVGVKLAAGSGAWASTSDRNAKTHIVPLDDDSILAKVTALPIDAWQYKTEAGVRHVGPMAQDFYAAFGVGEDDKHITSIDEDGVALAAIKSVAGNLARKDAQISQLRRADAQKGNEIAALRDELRRLERVVASTRPR